jgi:hypothetical protein
MTTCKIETLEHVKDDLYMQAIEKLTLKRELSWASRGNVTNENMVWVTMQG